MHWSDALVFQGHSNTAMFKPTSYCLRGMINTNVQTDLPNQLQIDANTMWFSEHEVFASIYWPRLPYTTSDDMKRVISNYSLERKKGRREITLLLLRHSDVMQISGENVHWVHVYVVYVTMHNVL